MIFVSLLPEVAPFMFMLIPPYLSEYCVSISGTLLGALAVLASFGAGRECITLLACWQQRWAAAAGNVGGGEDQNSTIEYIFFLCMHALQYHI